VARILFLTELLPYPLASGAKIRAYYVLRHLSSAHRVTLLSFVRCDDQPAHVAHLESFLDRVCTVPMQRSFVRNVRAAAVSVITGLPAIIAREDIGAMRRQVEQLLSAGQFDLVYADQIPMAQYALRGRKHGVKLLLDQHNATFQILSRLAQHERRALARFLLRREARAFTRYEARLCSWFDLVTFVSEEDQSALARVAANRRRFHSRRHPEGSAFQSGRTCVIPICVDTQSTPPIRVIEQPFRVTSVGTMYWPPNVEGLEWFVHEVWPQIHAQAPHARLTLIGKDPPRQLRALDAREDVDVLGYVEDVTRLLSETAAFIVPLHSGGGMRVKIVDSWCWGLATVSTSIGAEGIAIRDGENILIADAPAGFARAVLALLADPNLRVRLRVNGRQWVEQRYDWRVVYKAWDSVLERVLSDQ
jgi:glycosyltransferase involved in cell wall biosynthesis